MKWKCPICGKKFEHFGIKKFALVPKTILFSDFKIKDANGNIKKINRRRTSVCSKECKQKNEE